MSFLAFAIIFMGKIEREREREREKERERELVALLYLMVFGGSSTLCRKLVCSVNCGISWSCSLTSLESKEEGNDQESIQSSTTPDPGHHIGK